MLLVWSGLVWRVLYLQYKAPCFFQFLPCCACVWFCLVYVGVWFALRCVALPSYAMHFALFLAWMPLAGLSCCCFALCLHIFALRRCSALLSSALLALHCFALCCCSVLLLCIALLCIACATLRCLHYIVLLCVACATLLCSALLALHWFALRCCSALLCPVQCFALLVTIVIVLVV